MNKRLKSVLNKYMSRDLAFRVRLFNVLAVAGALVSLVSAAASAAIGEPAVNAVIYSAFCLLSAWLLWYSERSGRYQLCYLITVVAIFLVFKPHVPRCFSLACKTSVSPSTSRICARLVIAAFYLLCPALRGGVFYLCYHIYPARQSPNIKKASGLFLKCKN